MAWESTSTALPDPAASPPSTEDPSREGFLKAIQHEVIRQKIERAIMSLLFWGLIGFFYSYYIVAYEPDGFGLAWWQQVFGYGYLAMNVVMIVGAVYGLIKRNLKVIRLDSMVMGLIAMFNLGIAAIEISLGEGIYLAMWPLLMGLYQLAWSREEAKQYQRLLSWAAPLVKLSKEAIAPYRSTIHDFIRSDEDWNAWRLKARGKDNRPMTPGTRYRHRSMRGLVLGDRLLLVSQTRAELLWITRQQIQEARFMHGGAVRVDTSAGRWLVSFAPVSLLRVKHWAGIALENGDMNRARKTKAFTLDVIRAWLDFPDDPSRVLALNALGKQKRCPGASDLAAGMLEQSSGEVRAAACHALRRMGDATRHEQIVPLLAAPEAAVRTAAATYLAAFPDQATHNAVQAARSSETDATAGKALAKAEAVISKQTGQLHAVDDNPYSMTQP